MRRCATLIQRQGNDEISVPAVSLLRDGSGPTVGCCRAVSRVAEVPDRPSRPADHGVVPRLEGVIAEVALAAWPPVAPVADRPPVLPVVRPVILEDDLLSAVLDMLSSRGANLQALFVAHAAGVLMHDITFSHIANFSASLQQLALCGIWHVSFTAVNTMLNHLPLLQDVMLFFWQL